MAIMEISKEMHDNETVCMALLQEKLTVWKPLFQITPTVLRFEVQGEDIPEDDTLVVATFKKDTDGVITLTEIKQL